MEIALNQKQLKKALRAIRALVPRNPSQPFQSYALVECVEGTDNSMRIVYERPGVTLSMRLDCNSSGPCRFLLPVRHLPAKFAYSAVDVVYGESCDIVKFISPTETIAFDVFKPEGYSYSNVESGDCSACVYLKSGDLLDILKHTMFAAKQRATMERYVLNCVCIEFSDGQATAVATDRYRLAAKSVAIASGQGEHQAVIPTDIVRSVIQALDRTGKVCIKFAEDVLFLSTDRVTIRITNGGYTYPKWRVVFPEDLPEHRVVTNAAGLLKAVKEAAINAKHKDHSGIVFTFTNGRLLLKTECPQVGNGAAEIDVQYEGTEFSRKLNPRFVVEFLDIVSQETVEILVWGEREPLLFRAGKGYEYLVMPMFK